MSRFGRLTRQRPARLVVLPRKAFGEPSRASVLVRETVENSESSWKSKGGNSGGNSGGSSSGNASGGGYQNGGDNQEPGWRAALFKMIEGSATAFGSIFVLGLAGYSYHAYYKRLVLRKMENAFAVGYSSVELAAMSRHVDPNSPHSELMTVDFEDNDWIPRDEQAVIDGIVDGTIRGQYHLITGEKGTGKTSMLLKAMRKIGGEGVAMLEAHGDPEIFRVRLGKALDFEFHEDSIGGLFSFKGPRDTTALLDIERAFNKMEKIALTRKEKVGKPLVLIITGAHLIRDDEDGQDLLELIQQRAEMWAASNLVTVVFNSDEYWITERLMWQATRMRVTPVRDIPKSVAIKALREFRAQSFCEDVPSPVLNQVYDKIGGRLRHLTRVARSPDMLEACETICDRERRWLMSQCWILGGDLDPGAEDSQDIASSAMLLARALVQKEKTMRAAGAHTSNDNDGRLPQIPLYEAREIMTNPDWIKAHDHMNIFNIDSMGMVQADSVAMQNAMRDVCGRPGFDEQLQATLDRLDEIESLARTREVTLKDLREDGEYRAVVQTLGGKEASVVSFKAVNKEEAKKDPSEIVKHKK
ncbi:subtilisin-like protein [Apiospora arundinis]